MAITSGKFQKQTEQMVPGKDCFIEEVVIRKKRSEPLPAGNTVYLQICSPDNGEKINRIKSKKCLTKTDRKDKIVSVY